MHDSSCLDCRISGAREPLLRVGPLLGEPEVQGVAFSRFLATRENIFALVRDALLVRNTIAVMSWETANKIIR